MTEPSSAQADLLERWLDELGRWNPRINLTALPPAEWWERHALEPLRLLEVSAPPANARLVDIGSGGGAPGLPLAIVRPDLAVTLVEADRRKAAFLGHVVALLALGDRVAVVDRRAEEVGHDARHREAYDLATSRATAAPAVLCELALPLVRPGGSLAAFVGDAGAAAAACAEASRLCGGGPPRGAAPGVLAVPKVAPTDHRYPRRTGIPARRPLA